MNSISGGTYFTAPKDLYFFNCLLDGKQFKGDGLLFRWTMVGVMVSREGELLTLTKFNNRKNNKIMLFSLSAFIDEKACGIKALCVG